MCCMRRAYANGDRAACDARLTILPPRPAAIIALPTVCDMRNVPFKLTAIVLSQ